MAELMIRVGGFYRTRDGDVAKVISRDKDKTYIAQVDFLSHIKYTKSGVVNGYEETIHDLVEVITEAEYEEAKDRNKPDRKSFWSRLWGGK